LLGSVAPNGAANSEAVGSSCGSYSGRGYSGAIKSNR
jgi:hypothetical protein